MGGLTSHLASPGSMSLAANGDVTSCLAFRMHAEAASRY